jgi:hypothetical protein
MRRTARVTDALRGRKKAVAYVGTAAALLGAGTATAATISSTAHGADTAHAAAAAHAPATAHVAATAHVGAGAHAAGAGHATTVSVAKRPVKHATASAADQRSDNDRKTASVATRSAHVRSARRAAPAAPAKRESWGQIVETAAKVSHGTPAAANKLQPAAPTGPQAWMPISAAQHGNAKAIVKQAYAKKMGVRSAVIAVATAMQESTLNNINYGTSDSVGLFQQRPSCGWGTVQQIMDPAYAANAFLTALHQHQAGDPGWVTQPLWANAQAVQQSGFPFAYAKWEAQAVHMVKQITTQIG